MKADVLGDSDEIRGGNHRKKEQGWGKAAPGNGAQTRRLKGSCSMDADRRRLEDCWKRCDLEKGGGAFKYFEEEIKMWGGGGNKKSLKTPKLGRDTSTNKRTELSVTRNLNQPKRHLPSPNPHVQAEWGGGGSNKTIDEVSMQECTKGKIQA